MKYNFEYSEHCNMCGAPSSEAKILGKRMNLSQGKKPQKKVGIATTVVKCKNCDLIYPNPMPVPESLDQHYGTPSESYWTPEYFKIEQSYFAHQINTFFKLFGKTNADQKLKALDIGAGIGKCMVALDNAGFDAQGIEPSEPFYEKAIERTGISKSRLQMLPIEEADYPKNTFDFITFGAVLEHLYDPAESIRSTMKWLKPGGLVHIEVPSSRWFISKIINFFYSIRGLDYVTNVSPMHSPFHLYEFGLKSFEELAKKDNFEIVHYNYEVCKTYMPKPVDWFVVPYMRKTNSGMQLEIWLRKK
ncbi:methyltransferase type 11 [marine bacterium AO1-C]|nr:methyltransferase type 11 [marine bacterium AO1-C]